MMIVIILLLLLLHVTIITTTTIPTSTTVCPVSLLSSPNASPAGGVGGAERVGRGDGNQFVMPHEGVLGPLTPALPGGAVLL